MKKVILLLICVLIVFSCSVASADVDKSIINGKQAYLIMGSVKDINNNDIIITVDHVLGVEASALVGKDITVSNFVYSYCTYHTPHDFSYPVVSDNVVISVDYDGDKYVIKNGAFKVDSNEYSTCKIISHIEEDNEDCIKALAEITCFIRSNAKVKKFTFEENGSIYAVYPQTMEQCIQSVDDNGKAIVKSGHVEESLPEEVVNHSAPQDSKGKNIRSIYVALIFVIGAILGIVVSYIVSVKKDADKNI